jgi:predicted Zn-dependent protease
MASGDLPVGQAPEVLGTGLYLSNLWYCNFSDRNAARVTGMTRYACLWVENGEAVAPFAPMRFDDSLLELLGRRLVALTRERELLLDDSTYEGRSTAGMLLPGALVEGFTLTL